jgi:TPP-dependent pyruvate/acetoin dehydrogenase alpha subunit
LQKSFIGLTLRNQQLVELNNRLTEQFSVVVAELNQIKEERQEKEIQKQTRANRKRLPKRDPMTAEIYKELVKAAEGPTYINARTRISVF